MQYQLIRTVGEVSLVRDGQVVENFTTEGLGRLINPLASLIDKLQPGDTLTYGVEGA